MLIAEPAPGPEFLELFMCVLGNADLGLESWPVQLHALLSFFSNTLETVRQWIKIEETIRLQAESMAMISILNTYAPFEDMLSSLECQMHVEDGFLECQLHSVAENKNGKCDCSSSCPTVFLCSVSVTSNIAAG